MEETLFPAFWLLVKVLFYFAIVVVFFKQKTEEKKLKFILAIALVHVVLFLPGLQDDVIINSLILLVLVVFNVPLWIGRETALVLLLAILLLPTRQYFWLYLLAQAFFIITIGGLIFAAFESPKKT